MRDLSKVTCIEDLRRTFKRKVPKMFYEYVDSGSWTETTWRANNHDFDAIKFRQRVLVNMEGRTLSCKLLGQNATMPLAISPTGFTGMMYADGEILAARAAEKFGVPYTLSTMSICSLEEVAEHTNQPFWFQLYVMRDRDFIADLIHRARNAHCSALVLTADLQILGQRHKDIKNGLSAPPRPTLNNLLNFVLKPEWCWRMLHTKRRGFGNIIGHAKDVQDVSDVSIWTAKQFDPRLSWDDVARIKDQWGGKLIIKGILDAEDAKLAVQHGADALIVSNHGGRQLDGARSTISVLPEIIQAVGKQSEIYLDGGITTGQNALKAWAMGANGVMIGRAHLYGLGAYGEAGVTRALEILYREMDLSMAFTGHRTLQTVTHDILVNGSYPVM